MNNFEATGERTMSTMNTSKETIAETFMQMLSMSRTRSATDAIMDAIFAAKVWKRGTPEQAMFGFEDGSGLALESFDGSDAVEASTFAWERLSWDYTPNSKETY
jgi:hypothetical protein